MITLLLKLTGCLPLGLVRLIGRMLEYILRPFPNDLHRITRINIALTKPELGYAEQKTLTNKSVQSTLINALEMILVWQNNNHWLNNKLISIENETLIKGMCQSGKGLLVIAPHVGNWEVLGRKLTEYGPTTSLYRPPRQAHMDSLIREGRERSGAKLVPTSQRGIAALLRALRDGEIVGILPDQVPQPNAGIFAPFFNIPAYTMTLIYNLIRKTQCDVILAYALRTQNGFELIFKTVDESIFSDDMETSVNALSQTVERCTEEDFSQYQWSYKRFKRQENGVDFYKK